MMHPNKQAPDPDLDVSPWPARVGLAIYIASMVAFVTILLGWWRP